MSYNGPKERILTRIDNKNGFTKEGRPGFEESRNIFLQQTFEVTHVHDSAANPFILDTYWYEASETGDMQPKEGDELPISEPHIFDRFLLNRGISNCHFEPDQAYNTLQVYPGVQSRLAPLLCSKSSFNNVTREPKVDRTYFQRGGFDNTVHEEVFVQMGAYGRLWFGHTQVVAHANVPGHVGESPFEDRLVATHFVPTVKGVYPRDLPINQSLRMYGGHQLGEKGAGEMLWKYDAQRKIYYLSPFDIEIYLDSIYTHAAHGTANETKKHFRTPELSLRNFLAFKINISL